ncbi:MAG TPA: GAF and ANTAR domain-containing protein [Propionibacteriaceae bacterium]|jgi:GAF domain-containing protein
MDVKIDAVSDKTDDRLAALAWLAQGMDRQPDLEATLQAVVHQADRVDLGDSVGLLMVKGRTIAPSAASNPEVTRANQLQLECNQGPGVEAILSRRSFISSDLRLDERWRFWGPRAADAGWLSVLSVRLADGDTIGSLNVYSRQVHSFSPDDLVVAEAFAARAAIALANARERRPRAEAVQARRLLLRAQDVVVRKLHVDAEQAFAVLRRNASRSNKRISDVAADVVAGYSLPEYPSSLCGADDVALGGAGDAAGPTVRCGGAPK